MHFASFIIYAAVCTLICPSPSEIRAATGGGLYQARVKKCGAIVDQKWNEFHSDTLIMAGRWLPLDLSLS